MQENISLLCLLNKLFSNPHYVFELYKSFKVTYFYSFSTACLLPSNDQYAFENNIVDF